MKMIPTFGFLLALKRVLKRVLTKILIETIPWNFLRANAGSTILFKLRSSTFLETWFTQPLNAQKRRLVTVIDLALKYKPQIVVETGTFVGTTTPLFVPLAEEQIFTIEVNQEFLEQAREYFEGLGDFGSRIVPVLGDSMMELVRIAREIPPKKRCLFYLDAHWATELPLWNELKAIMSRGGSFVIVIDDFKIEDDDSFGYDQYGQHSVSIDSIPNQLQGELWFPDHSSIEESGGKRGTAYFFSQEALLDVDPRKVSGIRKFSRFEGEPQSK